MSREKGNHCDIRKNDKVTLIIIDIHVDLRLGLRRIILSFTSTGTPGDFVQVFVLCWKMVS